MDYTTYYEEKSFYSLFIENDIKDDIFSDILIIKNKNKNLKYFTITKQQYFSESPKYCRIFIDKPEYFISDFYLTNSDIDHLIKLLSNYWNLIIDQFEENILIPDYNNLKEKYYGNNEIEISKDWNEDIYIDKSYMFIRLNPLKYSNSIDEYLKYPYIELIDMINNKSSLISILNPSYIDYNNINFWKLNKLEIDYFNGLLLSKDSIYGCKTIWGYILNCLLSYAETYNIKINFDINQNIPDYYKLLK